MTHWLNHMPQLIFIYNLHQFWVTSSSLQTYKHNYTISKKKNWLNHFQKEKEKWTQSSWQKSKNIHNMTNMTTSKHIYILWAGISQITVQYSRKQCFIAVECNRIQSMKFFKFPSSFMSSLSVLLEGTD